MPSQNSVRNGHLAGEEEAGIEEERKKRPVHMTLNMKGDSSTSKIDRYKSREKIQTIDESRILKTSGQKPHRTRDKNHDVTKTETPPTSEKKNSDRPKRREQDSRRHHSSVKTHNRSKSLDQVPTPHRSKKAGPRLLTDTEDSSSDDDTMTDVLLNGIGQEGLTFLTKLPKHAMRRHSSRELRKAQSKSSALERHLPHNTVHNPEQDTTALTNGRSKSHTGLPNEKEQNSTHLKSKPKVTNSNVKSDGSDSIFGRLTNTQPSNVPRQRSFKERLKEQWKGEEKNVFKSRERIVSDTVNGFAVISSDNSLTEITEEDYIDFCDKKAEDTFLAAARASEKDSPENEPIFVVDVTVSERRQSFRTIRTSTGSVDLFRFFKPPSDPTFHDRLRVDGIAPRRSASEGDKPLGYVQDDVILSYDVTNASSRFGAKYYDDVTKEKGDSDGQKVQSCLGDSVPESCRNLQVRHFHLPADMSTYQRPVKVDDATSTADLEEAILASAYGQDEADIPFPDIAQTSVAQTSTTDLEEEILRCLGESDVIEYVSEQTSTTDLEEAILAELGLSDSREVAFQSTDTTKLTSTTGLLPPLENADSQTLPSLMELIGDINDKTILEDSSQNRASVSTTVDSPEFTRPEMANFVKSLRKELKSSLDKSIPSKSSPKIASTELTGPEMADLVKSLRKELRNRFDFESRETTEQVPDHLVDCPSGRVSAMRQKFVHRPEDSLPFGVYDHTTETVPPHPSVNERRNLYEMNVKIDGSSDEEKAPLHIDRGVVTPKRPSITVRKTSAATTNPDQESTNPPLQLYQERLRRLRKMPFAAALRSEELQALIDDEETFQNENQT